MFLKAVKYKNGYLAPGSMAMQLYNDKKFKELDAHLKQLDKDEAELLKRYRKVKPIGDGSALEKRRG